MTSGLVTPSSSRGRIIYEGEGGVLPFVTSLGPWITVGTRNLILKWEFRINESQENQQETQFIPPLTDRNSALKKCFLRDSFTWRNEWCYLARSYNFYPAHLELPFDMQTCRINRVFVLVKGVFVLVHGVFVLVHGVLGLCFWVFVLETPTLISRCVFRILSLSGWYALFDSRPDSLNSLF